MNEKQQPLFDTGDRRILAVLFAAGEPLELERLAEGLGVDKAALRQALERLQGRLQEAGLPLELLELEESVQLSHPGGVRRADPLGAEPEAQQSALPVGYGGAGHHRLQPAGDPCLCGADPGSGFQLGCELAGGTGPGGGGRTPGIARRPIAYRTTANFLRCFGLQSLEQLPDITAASPGQPDPAEEQEGRP